MCFSRKIICLAGAKELTYFPVTRLITAMRLRRWLLAAILFPGPVCLPGFAANIQLKSGAEYRDVKILNQTASTVRIYTAFGEISIPADSIAAIDGKKFIAPAPVTPPPVVVSPPSSTPAAIPANKPLPALALAGETILQPTPRPVLNAAPGPLPVVPRVYRHDSRMDYFLGGLLGAVLLWLGQLLWVQHWQNRRRQTALGWNTLVLLLPGVGLLIYLANALLGKKIAPLPEEDFAGRAGKTKLFGATAGRVKGQGIGLRFLDEGNQPVPLQKSSSDTSTLDRAREILEAAVVQRASDIHIEPQEDLWRVRLRVDGQLAELLTLEIIEGKRLVTAIKSLAQIDIAEKRQAQDGRFRVRTEIRDVDFRVATANSIFGEKVVIRILDRKGGLFSLDQVGMAQEMEATFDRTIHSRAGMIIVTGPTGSGKTSTLYAALSRLDRNRLNIMTIEDPVEYELPGATQIPVLPKAGVTYESGLRSILRQDPDVILIGEMRDAEAATVALRAALTGHLVFTSLHTRDTISTLVRLEEMGLDRTQISSALLMLVAQRLVRVLCPACRRQSVCGGGELEAIGLALPAGESIWEPVGCPACDGTGYRGRTAIFELLVLNDELRNAVSEGATQDVLLEMARKNGFRMYREDGAQKILGGITSVAEVLEAS